MDFRQEVEEKELTGKETELSELIYFKVYKSRVPVIEQPIKTAARMLVPGKSGLVMWCEVVATTVPLLQDRIQPCHGPSRSLLDAVLTLDFHYAGLYNG